MLAVDCQSGGCGGERTFAVSDLANFYSGRTVGEVLRRMRCSVAGAPRILDARVRPRRVPLLGSEARE